MTASYETLTGGRTKSDEIKAEYKKFLGRKLLLILFSLVAITLIGAVAATLGAYPITIIEVYSILFRGLFHYPETTAEIVVWNLRLPRIIMAILAGIGLAIAGTMMQGILRNPLASPFTLGISSAAGFGAALAILTGVGIFVGEYLVIANAFFFSLIPTFVILGFARYKRATPETMILAGIAMSFIFSAAISLLMFFAEPEAVKEAYFWMVGSLGRALWEDIAPVFTILLVCVSLLMWKSWDLNVIGAGDETAQSLGVNVEQSRKSIMITASLLTAGIISFTGTIGFIGLVSPHICRMLIGGDNRFLIPASGVVGAALLLAADTLARTVMAPIILPVGILTSTMGGPLFLYLLLRRTKEFW